MHSNLHKMHKEELAGRRRIQLASKWQQNKVNRYVFAITIFRVAAKNGQLYVQKTFLLFYFLILHHNLLQIDLAYYFHYLPFCYYKKKRESEKRP